MVASAYDFSGFGTITDVGGATGNLLAAILGRYPKPRGILFDMPHAVRDAPALIQAHGLEWIASRSKPAVSSKTCPPAATLICSPMSFTIGVRGYA